MQLPSEKKIFTLDRLIKQVNEWKLKQLSIVFTNGCFDILHAGHVDYLEKARLKGDKLIVGLNTDQSVKRNKGELRPINAQEVRAKLLSALYFIDAVILFDDETPYLLIDQLKPNILVKGSDYSIETIVGSDIVIERGGKVETINLLKGYSTTNMIKKIKNSY